MYSGANHSTLKKTHASHCNGAIHADIAGTDNNPIRHAGQWNTDIMSATYLSNIPREFVRAAAGFELKGKNQFDLPQNMVDPPSELESAVWPWADDWMHWFNRYAAMEEEIGSRVLTYLIQKSMKTSARRKES